MKRIFLGALIVLSLPTYGQTASTDGELLKAYEAKQASEHFTGPYEAKLIYRTLLYENELGPTDALITQENIAKLSQEMPDSYRKMLADIMLSQTKKNSIAPRELIQELETYRKEAAAKAEETAAADKPLNNSDKPDETEEPESSSTALSATETNTDTDTGTVAETANTNANTAAEVNTQTEPETDTDLKQSDSQEEDIQHQLQKIDLAKKSLQSEMNAIPASEKRLGKYNLGINPEAFR